MSDDDTRQRITPEMVVAFKRGDHSELCRLLHLKPWETNPLDAVGECPRSPTSMGALSWPKAKALREELEKAALLK